MSAPPGRTKFGPLKNWGKGTEAVQGQDFSHWSIRNHYNISEYEYIIRIMKSIKIHITVTNCTPRHTCCHRWRSILHSSASRQLALARLELQLHCWPGWLVDELQYLAGVLVGTSNIIKLLRYSWDLSRLSSPSNWSTGLSWQNSWKQRCCYRNWNSRRHQKESQIISLCHCHLKLLCDNQFRP